MALQSYHRTVEELEKVASLFWPRELAQQEAKLSIIPLLLETQESFISILKVVTNSIEGVFDIIKASSMPANLFLKHLVVLADFGGEMLKRVNKQFSSLFPDKTLSYLWVKDGQSIERTYRFQSLPVKSLSNAKLRLTGKSLLQKRYLDPLYQDVIALLLLGRASTNEEVANVLSKCEISDYLGSDKLDKFIRQRYIWVSRVTGGSQSNNLGQLAQQFVYNYLKDNLKVKNAEFKSNGHIPGVSHTASNKRTETTFDLVVSNGGKYVAIEVSFQVTTNSVIERKAGQAMARQQQIHERGHRIAYVLDGSGNFERVNALSTICDHSDCTVAFSRPELDKLCQFIREYFAEE